MSSSPKKHHIDNLLTLLLFGVFAVCVLSVLLIGARDYRAVTARDQASYSRRTCAQYISTKVRQTPSPESVSVSSFGGCRTLVFTEDIEGEPYLTRIYCYDGWLRELFCYAEGDFAPEDGEKVLEARDMELSLEDGLLSVSITDGAGEVTGLTLLVRGGEGAAS